MCAKLTRSRVVMVILKINLKHDWVTWGGSSSEVLPRVGWPLAMSMGDGLYYIS